MSNLKAANQTNLMFSDDSANYKGHFKITGLKGKKKKKRCCLFKMAPCHSVQQEIKLASMQTSWREIRNHSTVIIAVVLNQCLLKQSTKKTSRRSCEN